MHIFLPLTLFALSTPSTALSPPLPSTPLSLTSLTPNTTTLSREPWPGVPWTYTIDDYTSITFEHYGRTVCAAEPLCEERVRDAINDVLGIVHETYVAGSGEAGSFASGGVVFWFRQELEDMGVRRFVVEEVLATLRWVMLRCGTREVLSAALLWDGLLAASFELTFPGFGAG